MRASTARELERIREALNLGWSMAELRGRLRYGHATPPGTADYQFPRKPFHALPIGGEHSLDEQRIATGVAVGRLAERFGLDWPLRHHPDQAASETIDTLAAELWRALKAAEPDDDEPRIRPDAYPPGSAVATAWEAAAEAIYEWDEQIQDGLGVSVELLAAYQLGRGLAETFWALDPDAPEPAVMPSLETTDSPPHPASWEFLFGPRRQLMLSAYLHLLEGRLAPLTGSAVRGPLESWWELVRARRVRSRSQESLEALRAQQQNWRDVLLGSRDPTSFARHFGFRVALRQGLRVIQTLPLETTLAGAGIALLAVAGYFLGADTSHKGVAVVVSILGFFGVTGAGLLARAKAEAAVLSVRLREAFYRDIVEAQATVLPKGAPS